VSAPGFPAPPPHCAGGALRWAEVSPCGRYRYQLGRRWKAGRTLAFVMLNPSTADVLEDDPTLRRCLGFARAWNYGAVELVNLFAWRATDPRHLRAAHLAGEDVVGPLCDVRLGAVVERADQVVVAWGSLASRRWTLPRAEQVLRGLAEYDLGRLGPPCSDGQPRHPLYARADAPLEDHP